jgi:hypothetical protein
MSSDFIPDYSEYSAEELMDIYVNLDKTLNPELTKAVEDELKVKMNSLPPVKDENRVIEFIKKTKWWIAGISVVLILFIIRRLSFYSPGETPSMTLILLPLFIHIVVISVLLYFAQKGKIAAAVLIVLYFFYILFGNKIF